MLTVVSQVAAATSPPSWLCCLGDLCFSPTHQEKTASPTPKAGIYVILKTSVSSRKEGPRNEELQVGAPCYGTLCP